MRTRQLPIVLSAGLLVCSMIWAQAGAKPAGGQSLSVTESSASADNLLNGGPPAWNQIAVKRVALNRTPPLYDTDAGITSELLADKAFERPDGNRLINGSLRQAASHGAPQMRPQRDAKGLGPRAIRYACS